MEDKIKFPANVILIDVAFLNEVVYGAKNFLEGKLGRKLPDVDLPAWLSYLALDAGLREPLIPQHFDLTLFISS